MRHTRKQRRAPKPAAGPVHRVRVRDPTRDDTPISTIEFHRHLVELAVQAGADPKRARERMAQAAAVYCIELGLATERGRAELARARARVVIAKLPRRRRRRA